MDKLLKWLKTPWALLLMAALAAIVVTWMANSYLVSREQKIKEELEAGAKQRAPKVAVAVPMRDVAPGMVLDSVFVSRDIDEDLVDPDAVKAEDFERIRGQKLARPVLGGRQLRYSDLQAPEVRDVASVLPPGLRAVTIDVDNLNSFSHTLRPGHRVDVFLLTKYQKVGATLKNELDYVNNKATLFMQNLEVLATGRDFNDPATQEIKQSQDMVRPGDLREEGRSFDTITLLVDAGSAAKLLVGQKVGTFRVALRGKNDGEPIQLPPTTGEDVLPWRVARVGKSRRNDSPPEKIEYIVGGAGGGEMKRAALPAVAANQPINLEAGGSVQAELLKQLGQGLGRTQKN